MKAVFHKVGSLGALLTALCCIGTPGLLAFLTAIGVGFLINDAILLPLLIFFLGVTMFGLYSSYRSHKDLWPLATGGVDSLTVIIFAYGRFIKPLVYLGLVALVGTSISDMFLKKRCEAKKSS